MTDLTQETARLRGVDAPIATQIIMKLKEIGDFTATVRDRTDDGLVVALGLDETQYQLLLKRLYAGGAYQVSRQHGYRRSSRMPPPVLPASSGLAYLTAVLPVCTCLQARNC